MKRVFMHLLRLIVSFAAIFGGIYIETLFYDKGLKTFWILLYVFAVPGAVCGFLSTSRRKAKNKDDVVSKGESGGLALGFAFCGAILYWIVAGIAALVLFISESDNVSCYYVIYTILFYMYLIISLTFGRGLKDSTNGTVQEYGAKTMRTVWMFLLIIHFSAKFLIMYPEYFSNALFWVVIVFLSLLAINFGPARGDLLFICDWLFRKTKRISSKCPHCQKSFDLPVYVCPRCGKKHDDLIPTEDGRMWVECRCHEKLPTTFFNGRQKLEAHCPHCGCAIKDGGLHVDVCIPVIGGIGAGKTCFISQAIASIDEKAALYGLNYEYQKTDGDTYPADRNLLASGRLPGKTDSMRLSYHQFYLMPERRKLKNLISLCDVAGEVYAGNRELDGQMAYAYANAFLMVIDPLSVTSFRLESEKTTNKKYSYSPQTLDDISGRLTAMLENMFRISAKDELDTVVAVVFSKCDIYGLEERIGAKAVARLVDEEKIDMFEAQNRLCENFLNEYGETNFVNAMKSKFKTVQFFCSSALGHEANGKSFTPINVEIPVLWLLDKSDAKLGISQQLKKQYVLNS